MWPIRILIARLRPFNAAAVIKIAITAVIVALFLYGDFALFQRLFRAIAKVEATTPFFALGLLLNLAQQLPAGTGDLREEFRAG